LRDSDVSRVGRDIDRSGSLPSAPVVIPYIRSVASFPGIGWRSPQTSIVTVRDRSCMAVAGMRQHISGGCVA
jgi:hypothetical protein